MASGDLCHHQRQVRLFVTRAAKALSAGEKHGRCSVQPGGPVCSLPRIPPSIRTALASTLPYHGPEKEANQLAAVYGDQPRPHLNDVGATVSLGRPACSQGIMTPSSPGRTGHPLTASRNATIPRQGCEAYGTGWGKVEPRVAFPGNRPAGFVQQNEASGTLASRLNRRLQRALHLFHVVASCCCCATTCSRTASLHTVPDAHGHELPLWATPSCRGIKNAVMLISPIWFLQWGFEKDALEGRSSRPTTRRSQARLLVRTALRFSRLFRARLARKGGRCPAE